MKKPQQNAEFSACNSGRCNCVAQGTTVETSNGPQPVEVIQPGDRVWGYNQKRHEPVLTKVASIRPSIANETIRVVNFRATPEHQVFVNGMWRAASSLTAKDQLLGLDLVWRTTGSVELIDGAIQVYDLSVELPHNYFAGGILVHNRTEDNA